MEVTQTLLLLLAGHAVADYPLQGEYLAIAKRPKGNPDLAWPYALSAHAMIHSGAVALVTGSPILGVFEFLAHSAIDFAKCRGLIGLSADQGLHVACKVLWVALLFGGAV